MEKEIKEYEYWFDCGCDTYIIIIANNSREARKILKERFPEHKNAELIDREIYNWVVK